MDATDPGLSGSMTGSTEVWKNIIEENAGFCSTYTLSQVNSLPSAIDGEIRYRLSYYNACAMTVSLAQQISTTLIFRDSSSPHFLSWTCVGSTASAWVLTKSQVIRNGWMMTQDIELFLPTCWNQLSSDGCHVFNLIRALPWFASQRMSRKVKDPGYPSPLSKHRSLIWRCDCDQGTSLKQHHSIRPKNDLWSCPC